MERLKIAAEAVGATLIVVGVALMSLPAAIVTVGVMLVAAGNVERS